jgi:aspartyl-tRNA(Asn)/glutamyl-tRNA(Gln) amidotransferase subunit B
MEEDAGKLVHEGDTISVSNSSLVDYNRAGVPLIEIVSEPDMRSAEEAKAYLEKLKAYIEYTGVSDVKMEQGSLRCDANVSVRPFGQKEFGTRAEVKNLNSFRAVQKAIEYEVERQIELIEDGGKVVQETRTWDDAQGITLILRGKEEANDYRYFPDPDLTPLIISREYVEEIRKTIPELPDVKKERLINEMGLPEYDAGVITSSKGLAAFFDETVAIYPDAKKVCNWLMVEFCRLLNSESVEIENSQVTPEKLAALLKLVDDGTISGKIAKTVFEEMFISGKNPEVIVEEKGLVQISDEGALGAMIDKIIAENPKSVEDYKSGNKKALGFFVGKIMKETQGQANPGMVNKMLTERLD